MRNRVINRLGATISTGGRSHPHRTPGLVPQCFQVNFRRHRRFVVAVDAGKVFQLAAPRLGIQALCIAPLTFFQRRIDKDFDELAGSNKPRANWRSARKAK